MYTELEAVGTKSIYLPSGGQTRCVEGQAIESAELGRFGEPIFNPILQDFTVEPLNYGVPGPLFRTEDVTNIVITK